MHHLLTPTIRQSFLDFFAKNSHTIVPSAPLVPKGDASLLFTNAGMVPFKEYFLGTSSPPLHALTSCQVCVRAGGKHNDLENVGYTPRHHTLFEMLGNFSFGHYGKEEAIAFAWNLLTKEWGIDGARLWVTVHINDADTKAIWSRATTIPHDHVRLVDSDDNFWAMGDTGPCGFCTEIYYDYGSHLPGTLPDGNPCIDGPRFVELWNLVFMSMLQHEDGSRTPLTQLGVDTGMGLERIACVLQGVDDNFKTDGFTALIDASATITGKNPQGKPYFSHRIIADHTRAASFLIADGVTPGPEGRSYVLRRIIRRGLQHAYELGRPLDLMAQVAETVVAQMGSHYTHLIPAKAAITAMLLDEGERFYTTLERGLRVLNIHLAHKTPGSLIPGDTLFALYDTHGFPLDLAKDILKEKGFRADEEGFEKAMDAQKARGNWKKAENETEKWDWIQGYASTSFVGYDTLTAPATVLAAKPKDQETVYFIVNKTPFYGEMGGQTADRGHLVVENPLGTTDSFGHATVGEKHTFPIEDVQHQGPYLIHTARISTSLLQAGVSITLAVNPVHRAAVARHHSATHLLHAALRTFLGEHIVQKGSFVGASYLRFDFSHHEALSPETLQAITLWVNRKIWENHRVVLYTTSLQKALSHGVIALFGEKYPEEVRVVQMGDTEITSQELCGGTHVHATGDIGTFMITKEGSLGAGVRRIEACCAESALSYIQEREQTLQALTQLLHVPPTGMLSHIKSLKASLQEARKDIANAQKEAVLRDTTNPMEILAGVPILVRYAAALSGGLLKEIADALCKQHKGIAIVLNQPHVPMGQPSMVTFCVMVSSGTPIQALHLAKALQELAGGGRVGGNATLSQGTYTTMPTYAAIVDTIRSMLHNA